MTTRIIYEAMPIGCRDFAMPVQETVSDWYDYCPSCEASVNETDYKAGACTQCKRQLSAKETTTMSNTNPLERSEWSFGWSDNFIYFDYALTNDDKVTIHCAYDFNGKPLGNVTADFERVTVAQEQAAQSASDMVNRAVQWFRETTGHTPRPIQSARNFIRAVQQLSDYEGGE